MALDPNIALGVRPLEVSNPLAQYAQIAQLKNFQNQDALAQYQLGAAQRTEARDVARMNALAQAGTDETAIGNALLKSGDIKGYSDFIKANREGQKALIDMQDIKLKQSRSFLDTIDPTDPNAPAKYIAWHEANHRDPILGPMLAARGVTAEQARAGIDAAIARGPQAFADLVNQSKLGVDRFMELNKPSTYAQDTGAGGRLVSRPGLGGAVTVVPGSEFTKTKTFADINAADRLKFEKDKFAWEKANPGYELKEDANGNFYGVNTRTLQAFPVTIGGAAAEPAPAAPAASGGIPGARTPAPAIAPAAPAAGAAPAQPLTGKGQALTESQGNATAFGMRMLDANKMLTDLEKKNVTSGGRVKGAVEGTLTSLIPYQGANLAEGAGSIMNVLPGFMGGPSGPQQQYDQAKRNFITAVLRKESGASIAPSEFANEEKKYFPQAGDTDEVIKQKQRARGLAVEAMKVQAGPGAKSIKPYEPTADDPLGLGVR